VHDDSHGFDHSADDGIFDDDFPRSHRRSRHDRTDLSGAPSWVKAFVWTGALLAIAGIGVVMFGVLIPPDPREPFSNFPTPDPTGQLTLPSFGGPNLSLGFGLFFAGFVLTAIGALGHSTSKRR
jgi:hypothetical protein